MPHFALPITCSCGRHVSESRTDSPSLFLAIARLTQLLAGSLEMIGFAEGAGIGGAEPGCGGCSHRHGTCVFDSNL